MSKNTHKAALSSALITKENAKAILKGRQPYEIVEYGAAKAAIQLCTTIIETKQWADKADALAAYAKIYHDEQLLRDARKLRVVAGRKMGLLALSENHTKLDSRGIVRNGTCDLLMDSGLPRRHARNVIAVARLTNDTFDRAIDRPIAPTMSTLAKMYENRTPQLSELKQALSRLCRCDSAELKQELLSETPIFKNQLKTQVTEALEVCDAVLHILELNEAPEYASMYTIATMLNLDRSTVDRLLHKYNPPIRCTSTATGHKQFHVDDFLKWWSTRPNQQYIQTKSPSNDTNEQALSKVAP